MHIFGYADKTVVFGVEIIFARAKKKVRREEKDIANIFEWKSYIWVKHERSVNMWGSEKKIFFIIMSKASNNMTPQGGDNEIVT